ncbi:hypothetical protein [Nocardioides albidus]|nr:hypothetical protein [Nocardioides albidus]
MERCRRRVAVGPPPTPAAGQMPEVAKVTVAESDILDGIARFLVQF